MLTRDHLVFATDDLERGADWMTHALGVGPTGGGAHPLMGTHNRLWRMGDLYMEVISIDPAAPEPQRRRWFGLDGVAIQARLTGAPQLLTWVAQVPADSDLETMAANLPLDPGVVVRLTRDDLWWDLTVPADGQPVQGGVWPSLIRWPAGVRSPALSLPDSGVRLDDLSYTGDTHLGAALEDLGASDLIRCAGSSPHPTLSATLRRPDGKLIIV